MIQSRCDFTHRMLRIMDDRQESLDRARRNLQTAQLTAPRYIHSPYQNNVSFPLLSTIIMSSLKAPVNPYLKRKGRYSITAPRLGQRSNDYSGIDSLRALKQMGPSSKRSMVSSLVRRRCAYSSIQVADVPIGLQSKFNRFVIKINHKPKG